MQLGIRAIVSLVSMALAVSCGDDDTPPASPPDAATDSTPPEAGRDLGAPDTGTPDAGDETTDIGCPDCTSFVGGRVFDGTTTRNLAVVVEGETIRSVVEGAVRVTAGDTVDLAGRTLLPGLHDLHVHLFADSSPYAYQPREDHLHDHLKSLLRAGVTTILDVGSPQAEIFELRERIRARQILAPTLLAAGPLVTATGGHPCRSGSPPRDFCVLVDDATEIAQLMEHVLPDQPDVIKIVLEAGTVASPLPRLRFDLLEGIRMVADEESVPVVAHVSRTEDIAAALDAGIRTFVHMPFLDAMTPELCERAARDGAVIVPTLVVMDSLARWSQGRLTELDDPTLANEVPQEILDALANRSFRPVLSAEFLDGFAVSRDSVRTCFEAGVAIAAGTDSGNPGTFHGYSLRTELIHYVEAGMTPEQSLASATRVAADALGLDDRGRIVEGARADLLVVEGDPSEDITDLERVSAVYLAGEALDLASLALPLGTDITRTPIPPREADETCLDGDECVDGRGCVSFPSASCLPTCDDGVCAAGTGCIDLGEGPFCYSSDDCDLVAQDCPNGASCLWLGSGLTMCLYAGSVAEGERCGFGGGFCSSGTQCIGAVCRRHCRPSEPSDCAAGESCEDHSAEAGLPIGACVPAM